MVRKQFGAVALALACAGVMGDGAVADVAVIECAASEPSVVLTRALQSYGLSDQDAHEIALIATEGVFLQDQPQVCLAYLVTMHWCEQVNGETVSRRMNVRLSADCLGNVGSDIKNCLEFNCGPGKVPMLRLPTGNNACSPIPSQACVNIEISGPVETKCDFAVDCACMAFLTDLPCEEVVECVDVEGAPDSLVAVPSACPSCD